MDTLPLSGLPIKALSLWQPWASLMAAGVKPDETRSWSTNYRGPIAIHAAKTIDRVGAPLRLCVCALGPHWWDDLPAGAVVAIGMLTACQPTEAVRRAITPVNRAAGDFSHGRFALRVDNIRPLLQPIPLIGRQGLFNWVPPSDIEDRLGPVADHLASLRRHGLSAYAEAA